MQKVGEDHEEGKDAENHGLDDHSDRINSSRSCE
jgi:hypothetical protein